MKNLEPIERKITELECAAKSGNNTIEVWIYDNDTGIHTKRTPGGAVETLTAEEWQAYCEGNNDTIIDVHYGEE